MTHYSVDLSGGITESFFTELEKFSTSNLPLRKRLTEITIELFQNINKHAAKLNHSKLFIEKKSDSYSLVAINTVTADDAKFLQTQIKYINALDSAQLKRQHTHILGSTTRSKKSGAGLGLYRIALRSASRMIASFKQIDQQYFIFSLHVTLTSQT